MCLQIHQGRRPHYGAAEAVLANADDIMTESYGQVPGGAGQVRIDFALVTLVYATFNIDIPRQQTDQTWSAFYFQGSLLRRVITTTISILPMAQLLKS